MPGRRATPWIIATLSGMVLLPQLGAAPLWDEDEPLNAACSLAMHAGGDWLVPTFNGRLRIEKPALVNWLQLGGFALAGVNEGGARLGSALLTIGTCLLTWDIARRLFDPTAAAWSGIVMATFLWTGIAGRAATPDAALGFFTTLALAAFVRGMTLPGGTAGQVPPGAAVAAGAAAGAAVLAKGPVGLCLPLAAFWLFSLADFGPGPSPEDQALPGRRAPGLGARLLRAWRDARLAVIGLAALAVAAPWYAAVTVATEGEWLRGFLLVHNLGRLSAPMEGHSGSPLFYYPAVLLIGSFPWSSGWIPAARHAWTTARGTGREARGSRLLAAWIAAWVVPFSLAATKLPGYVWPAYPALACLTGLFLADWIRRTDAAADRWMRLAWLALGASGLILAAGLGIAAARFAPESRWLALLGIVPLGGAVAAWIAHSRAGRGRAAAVWAVTAAATIGCLVTVVPTVAGGGGVRRLIASASARNAGSLVLYNAPPSAVFYAGRLTERARVPEARSPDALAALLAEDRAALVMVDARFATEVETVLPPEYRLLDSALVQPAGRRVLLLGPDPGAGPPVLAARAERCRPPSGPASASPR